MYFSQNSQGWSFLVWNFLGQSKKLETFRGFFKKVYPSKSSTPAPPHPPLPLPPLSLFFSGIAYWQLLKYSYATLCWHRLFTTCNILPSSVTEQYSKIRAAGPAEYPKNCTTLLCSSLRSESAAFRRDFIDTHCRLSFTHNISGRNNWHICNFQIL